MFVDEQAYLNQFFNFSHSDFFDETREELVDDVVVEDLVSLLQDTHMEDVEWEQDVDSAEAEWPSQPCSNDTLEPLLPLFDDWKVAQPRTPVQHYCVNVDLLKVPRRRPWESNVRLARDREDETDAQFDTLEVAGHAIDDPAAEVEPQCGQDAPTPHSLEVPDHSVECSTPEVELQCSHDNLAQESRSVMKLSTPQVKCMKPKSQPKPKSCGVTKHTSVPSKPAVESSSAPTRKFVKSKPVARLKQAQNQATAPPTRQTKKLSVNRNVEPPLTKDISNIKHEQLKVNLESIELAIEDTVDAADNGKGGDAADSESDYAEDDEEDQSWGEKKTRRTSKKSAAQRSKKKKSTTGRRSNSRKDSLAAAKKAFTKELAMPSKRGKLYHSKFEPIKDCAIFVGPPRTDSSQNKKAYENLKFFDLLYNTLEEKGFDVSKFKVPRPSMKCGFKNCPERRKVHNSIEHYTRHFCTHLPDNLCYVTVCPGCGAGTKRGDMSDRHIGKCKRKRPGYSTSEKSLDEFKAEYAKNVWLIVPESTPEVQAIVTEQRNVGNRGYFPDW